MRINAQSTMRTAAACALTAGLFALLAWGGVSLAEAGERIAPLWLPNALLVGVMLRDREGRIPALALSCLLTNTAVNLGLDVPLFRAAAFSCANAAEAVAAAWMIRRWCGRSPDLADLGDLGRFCVVAGLVAPAFSGLVACLVLTMDTGAIGFEPWFIWSATDALGLLIGGPITMAAIDAWRGYRWRGAGELLEGAAVLAIGWSAAAGVFSQSRYPLLFMVGPMVVITAFRMSGFGVALFVAGVTAIGTVATAFGSGPISLVSDSAVVKLLILQLFLAATFIMGLPVSAVLARLARTRAELGRVNELAESTLRVMREVVFRTDRDGRWVFLNPAWEALSGRSVADTLGRRASEALHPDDFAAARDLFPRIASGELAETMLEQRVVTAAGESRHVEVSVRGLWTPDGRFDGAAGAIRDVTERRRAQDALAASERRFHALADLAPAGMFRADADGAVTFVNRAFSAWTGLSPAEAAGEGWLRILPEKDRASMRTAWRRMISDPAHWSGDLRYLTADGTLSWVHATTAPIFDEEGRVDGFIGIHLDINERKAAEAGLAESEAQLRLLATNATDAVFRLDLDGTCRYASPSVGELLGVPPETLVGNSMLQRFHPDEDMEVRAAFARLAAGEIDRELIRYRSKPFGGAWKWLEANCGLVRDTGSGAPQELIVSIRDISGRKAMEDELALARDAAHAAARAKADFLAHMSHEIRTPMNGVLGFTQLLLASDLGPEQHEQVRMLAESGQAMMRLLNDILDLSKIEAGRMTTEPRPTDLRHAARGCLQLMVPSAVRRAVDLDCEFDEDVPALVLCDDLRFRQIMLNLLGNAVKFTSNGRVSVRGRMKNEGLVAIEVRDTGVGIPADRLQAIFDPFAQADSSTARRFGGTGLGLTISSQLATLLGGALTVESEVGRGSCFTLTLPAQVAQAPVMEQPRAAPVASPAPTRRPRVLLAEDHEVNQMLATAMLEGLGCRVELARDGVEAVAALGGAQDDPFDLVLMDVRMPNMDGLEATRLARGEGIAAPDLPIVALTANAYPEDIAACLKAGMQGHIAKPLKMTDLADAIARWTGSARLAA